MHTPLHVAGYPGAQRTQSGKLGERHGKLDVGFGVGQPVHLEGLRPGCHPAPGNSRSPRTVDTHLSLRRAISRGPAMGRV